MFSIELGLRLIAVLIFILWAQYWLIAEKEADREKPKNHSQGKYRSWLKLGLRIVSALLLLQLLGLPLLPIEAPATILFIMQIIGFLLILSGVSVSVIARKNLGTNWAHAFDYQIKQKQELVTSGIYQYIRHPIYTGLMLAMIGGELLAQSYLVVPMFVLQLGAGYKQAKAEEKILLEHFENKYHTYMRRTKMFIPFIW